MSDLLDILAQELDDCGQRIREGATISSCLDLYPEHADDLRPLLDTLEQASAFIPVPLRAADVAAQSRQQFMDAVADLAAALQAITTPGAVLVTGNGRNGYHGARVPVSVSLGERFAAWWASVKAGFRTLSPMPAGLAAALVFVLLTGLLTTGVVVASADDAPGDSLYNVKLASEQVRLFFAFDPESRQSLSEQFRLTRLTELRSLTDKKRELTHLPLAGQLDAVGPDMFVVAGLDVYLSPDSKIHGLAVVGAWVSGTVRSTADGRLVAEDLTISAPGTSVPPVPVTLGASPTPTSTAPADTATPPPTPTVAGIPIFVPGDWPSDESLMRVTRTPTPTRTRIPSSTPTATPTRGSPTSTVMPTPTFVWETRPPEQKVNVEGYLTAKAGRRWTVNGTTFDVDGNTQVSGNPSVGDTVKCTLLVRYDGSLLALVINLLARAPTPQLYTVQGRVNAIGGSTWTIGATVVNIEAGTVIEGSPQVGDNARCDCERRWNGIFAKRIEKVVLDNFGITGVIEAVYGDGWTIDGQRLYRDGQTQVAGTPAAGRIAEASGVILLDGRSMVRSLTVWPDTPTPPPTDTPAPPTPTNTPVPPTPTNTPVPPTPTNTSEPPTPTNTTAPKKTKAPGESEAVPLAPSLQPARLDNPAAGLTWPVRSMT